MQPIAEVISSSITSIVAECPQSAGKKNITKPYFGSFISIESELTNLKYIAVVYNITTASTDSAHKPIAFGMTRAQLLNEQPQIYLLLQTQIHAQIVGFIRNNQGFSYLPPQPPEVHDFVYFAEAADLKKIVDNFDFIRLLSEINVMANDELIAAAIREAYSINNNDKQFLLKAGQVLAQLFQSDAQRLLAVLKRIQPEPIEHH